MADKESEEPEEQSGTRYFMTGNQKVCFRCKKPGHFVNQCPEVPKCLICLSSDSKHIQKDCDQIACFICYKKGHHKKFCPNA